MKGKIKNILISVAGLVLVAVPAMGVPATVLAATPIQSSLCSGSNLDITNAQNTCSSQGQTDIQSILTTVINWFSIVVGVIAVIMIIIGGLKYITSGGESGKVSSAKTTIIYALIGLVVVALAQLIVHFVLNQANNLAIGG